ncbi:hypothetical protein D9619_003530 [Psilocybe cf. subviscida]|uniref:F-box domain-containing protein n=1 Tax=Psilocybe cf. subviscida TaxID=2480587 RepID=A0A8H5EUS4_9AGAR|nr:hypothetical protein D9619_003530 [Psilocybe cf. subviscida]
MLNTISPAVEEAAQRVDTQILQYLDLIQDLKSQRNALMPISQLPVEILGKIFHEVRGHLRNGQDDDTRFWTISSYSEPSLKWVSVSHISRHWRKVAIDDASLWTNPPLKNLQWTMIMLERSRVATIPAITLKVDELDQRVVTAIMPHIPRMSSLVIPNMGREMLKQVLFGLPSTAPTLRTLSISCLKKVIDSFRGQTWCYAVGSSSYAKAVAFPDNVLCHTPKLQHLELNDIVIRPNSPLLSRLTTLSMSGIPEKSKPTPQQLKTMLKSAPYLKRLVLRGVCPSAGSNQQKEWTAPVLMQHLEDIDINDAIPQLICFFGLLSATHVLKRINIDLTYEEGSASDLPLLFAALDQPYLRFLIGSSTDVRRLEVANDDAGLIIRALKISTSERRMEPNKREGYHWDHRRDCQSMTISIETPDLEDEDANNWTDTLLPILFNNMTWTGLSELDLASLFYASPQVLALTFGTVPHLRIIVADSYIAPWLGMRTVAVCTGIRPPVTGTRNRTVNCLEQTPTVWVQFGFEP